jgi:GntR family transcriptional regulator, transcriptional repressor for pyruvate dehydrogenase complex
MGSTKMVVQVRASEAAGKRFSRPRGTSSEQIAKEIRRYIAQHGIQPDERLGTENELANEFGVSRPTLREALRLLASSHLIRATRGPGGGVFVASTQNEGMGRNLSESIATMVETESVSLRELVEARIQLEVPLAGLAAEQASPQTTVELEQAIAEGEQYVVYPASDEFRLADARFHREIARTAGNELLRAFTSWTLDVLQPLLVARVGGTVDGDTILRQHRAILRAIRRRQPAAAQRAMRRHLEYILERTLAVEGAPDAMTSTASPHVEKRRSSR